MANRLWRIGIWRTGSYGKLAYGKKAYGKLSYSHINNKLTWDTHVNSVSQGLKGPTARLRIIANKLNKGMMIRIITAQIFSILCSSCQLMLTPSLSYNNMKRIKTAYYMALRVAIKDGKRKINRARIDNLTRWMHPRSWMKFSATSFNIRVTRDCMPIRLKQAIIQICYSETRKQGLLFSKDTSACKNGHKSMKNWIGIFP